MPRTNIPTSQQRFSPAVMAAVVFATIGLAACRDSLFQPQEQGAEIKPDFVTITDLGNGESLLRIDMEDARATWSSSFSGDLHPDSYEEYGIRIDSAYLKKELLPYWSYGLSGGAWLEPMWSPAANGDYHPGNIKISFSSRAPGIVKAVRAHVGRYSYTGDDRFTETGTLTCYLGSSVVGVQTAETPDPPHNLVTAPPYLPVEVRGDNISHCVLGSGAYFVWDDLEVTFAKASVNCTPATVTRGQEVVCQVTSSASGTVIRWEFEGDNIGNDPTLSISEALAADMWRGPAVESGTVTAVLKNGTSVTGRFDVQPRMGGWHWDSTRWTFTQGTAADCGNTEPSPGGTYQIGWNRTAGSPKHHCGASVRHRRILPILDLQPNSGYAVASVASGPNRGRWYVTGASFHMARASNLNSSLLPGAPTHRIRDTLQVRLCRAGMALGPKDPVFANFYTFNKHCMGLAVDLMLDGAWGHEGHGFNGGSGHESLAWAAAALPQNDPYAIEQYTRSSETDLRTVIRVVVDAASSGIENQSADPLPRGNWAGGSVWMWDASARTYVLTPLRSF